MSRVLFLVTSATTVRAFGGPIIEALEAAGHEVLVACGDADTGLGDGLEAVNLPLARSGNPLDAARAAVALARLIRRWGPDAVVCATPIASFLGVCVARLLRVPAVVYLAWGLRSETLPGVAGAVVRGAEGLTTRWAHLTLANSPSLRDAVIDANPSAEARVECLGAGSSHGVDIDVFRPAERTAGPVKIGFVGRLRRDKGVAELLEATASMHAKGLAFELELTGVLEDDTLKQDLAGHPVAVVRQATSQIAEVMQALDVLCLPSWREGFPNVVLEASATGIPVVTTTATGARDSVRDGVTGLVVEVRNVDALESALSRLVEDADLRAALGTAGRTWVEENFGRVMVCNRLAERVSVEIRAWTARDTDQERRRW